MRRSSIIIILFLIFPWLLAAQTMVLDWADDEYELQVILPGETEAMGIDELSDAGIDIYADGLPVGSVISTNNTYAEFYLEPNGSILKLSKDTEFSVFQLENNDGKSNEFTLSGKLRMVAAKATGSSKSRYNIRTESVVCGVRGTDFILDSITGNAYLKEGAINLLDEVSGAVIDLVPGQGSNLFGGTFTSFEIDPGMLADLWDQMSFKNLIPADVPGAPADEGTEGTSEESGSVEEVPGAEEGTAVAAEESALTKFLRDNLGFEIGSITIDGQTYAKAVIQPEFKIGKLGLALYLPVIYTENLFDPADWHHPDGNDEWSFGTDQSGWENILTDVLSDLFLKIKYVKWGDNRDKFFFSAGNLDDMTIGHGMLMKNYSNNSDFPAIRKVGFTIGADLGKFGFEAVVTDLSDLEIFGGRLYTRAGKLAFGFSTIVDINPQDSVDPLLMVTDNFGDPIFFNVGLDLDLSIIETDAFGIYAYADVGAMLPYLREDASIGGETVNAGFRFDAIVNYDNGNLDWQDRIKNIGFKAGLAGNVSIVDWLAEFQFFKGTFRPAFFDATYNHLRGQYVVQTLNYLASLDDLTSTGPDYTMGIYGEAKVSILGKINIELGYRYPWQYENGNVSMGDDDYLHVGLEVIKGTIPILGLYGSIYYDRTGFIPTLTGKDGFENFGLFDGNTVFGGELVYPIAPTLELALLFSRTVKQVNGITQYKANGQPIIVPSIGIETRINF